MFPQASNLLRNSITGMVMWIAALIPTLIAVNMSNDSLQLVLGMVLCGFMYSAIYARITQFCWCFKAATMSSSVTKAVSA
jgi:hypothetical protein